MNKYYTRACNFYFGSYAKSLIKKKLALPLCGNSQVAFDKIELISRKNNKIISKIININSVKTLNVFHKKSKTRLKKITSKKEKIF